MPYQDRRDAGRKLARHLSHYANHRDVIVLGLPQGGVPVAYEVSQALNAPLDVFVVRKLGLPGHEELAMGAIASGGVRVLNEELIRMRTISAETIEEVTQEELRELVRRERLYRGKRVPLPVQDRKVLLIDDGLATGSTVRAAIRALRQLDPAAIIVAVPVGSKDTCEELHREADEVICAQTPEPFGAVGYWYADFRPTSDAEVQDLLAQTSSAVHSER